MRTLEKILRLDSALDVEQLNRIADAFGVTPDELVAAARRNGELYLADGTFNPEHIRGEAPSRDSIERAALRRRPENAG